jgi:hypothetical protein
MRTNLADVHCARLIGATYLPPLADILEQSMSTSLINEALT